MEYLRQSLIAIEPDAVKRGLIGRIITRFEDTGLTIIHLRQTHLTPDQARIHASTYLEKIRLVKKEEPDLNKFEEPDFSKLVEYISGGPLVAMVIDGDDANVGRKASRLVGQVPGSLENDSGSINESYGGLIDRPIVNFTETMEALSKAEKIFFPSSKGLVKEKIPEEITLDPVKQSFITIFPDAVRRGKIGNIITRFEEKEFTIAALKMVTPTKEQGAAYFYKFRNRPFFYPLVNYLISGSVVGMIVEDGIGRGSRKEINEWHRIADITGGTPNSQEASPGTIQGDYAYTIERFAIEKNFSSEEFMEQSAIFFPEYYRNIFQNDFQI